jgi:hypothetical protein
MAASAGAALHNRIPSVLTCQGWLRVCPEMFNGVLDPRPLSKTERIEIVGNTPRKGHGVVNVISHERATRFGSEHVC